MLTAGKRVHTLSLPIPPFLREGGSPSCAEGRAGAAQGQARSAAVTAMLACLPARGLARLPAVAMSSPGLAEQNLESPSIYSYPFLLLGRCSGKLRSVEIKGARVQFRIIVCVWFCCLSVQKT